MQFLFMLCNILYSIRNLDKSAVMEAGMSKVALIWVLSKRFHKMKTPRFIAAAKLYAYWIGNPLLSVTAVPI
jgi:hypothetical protein